MAYWINFKDAAGGPTYSSRITQNVYMSLRDTQFSLLLSLSKCISFSGKSYFGIVCTNSSNSSSRNAMWAQSQVLLLFPFIFPLSPCFTPSRSLSPKGRKGSHTKKMIIFCHDILQQNKYNVWRGKYYYCSLI